MQPRRTLRWQPRRELLTQNTRPERRPGKRVSPRHRDLQEDTDGKNLRNGFRGMGASRVDRREHGSAFGWSPDLHRRSAIDRGDPGREAAGAEENRAARAILAN